MSKDIKKELKFTCEYCQKQFASSRAKGGHTSKAHPGKSKKFKSKMQLREYREPIREEH